MEESGVALMDVPSTLSNQRLTQNSPRRLFDLSHGILFVTVLVALFFLFLLFRDNVRQRRLQAQLKSELAVSARGLVGPPQAEPGDIVPAFESVGLADGKPTRVLYDGQTRYLLFFMSLDCDACLTQLPIWNSVAQKIQSGSKVLGVVVDNRSITIPPANFTILSAPSVSLQRAYRVVEVPLAMVVSKNGIVEWVHYGQLSDDQVAELISVIEKKS